MTAMAGGKKFPNRLTKPKIWRMRPMNVHLINTSRIPKKKQMIPGARSRFVNSRIVRCMPIMNTSPVRKRKSPMAIKVESRRKRTPMEMKRKLRPNRPMPIFLLSSNMVQFWCERRWRNCQVCAVCVVGAYPAAP